MLGQTFDGAALTCTRAGDDANSRDFGASRKRKKSLAQRRRHGFFNPVDSASPSIGHTRQVWRTFYPFIIIFLLSCFTWFNLF
jgi:hypothetical protein